MVVSALFTVAREAGHMAAERRCLDALYEAYNDHDPQAAAALYDPDGVHEDVSIGRPFQDRAAIVLGLRGFFAAIPDAYWRPLGLCLADHMAFGCYVLTGSLQHDMGPFTARGQRLELPVVHVLEFDHGVIRRSEGYWDTSTFHSQTNAQRGGQHQFEHGHPAPRCAARRPAGSPVGRDLTDLHDPPKVNGNCAPRSPTTTSVTWNRRGRTSTGSSTGPAIPYRCRSTH